MTDREDDALEQVVRRAIGEFANRGGLRRPELAAYLTRRTGVRHTIVELQPVLRRLRRRGEIIWRHFAWFPSR